MNKNRISIVISIISLLISIINFTCICKHYTLEVDYVGLLVGILSFLTTALLGWNIYQLIDVKELQKKYHHIEKEFNYTHNKMDYAYGISLLSQAQTLACHLCTNTQDRGLLKYNMLNLSLEGIKILSKLGCISECNSLIDTLIEAMGTSIDTKLTECEYNSIIPLFDEFPFKGLKNIKRLKELVEESKENIGG